MSEVKWIKLSSNIFDDEKIALIESMPSCDEIIVIWFKLLCLAGKSNNGGVFILNDRIHYTVDMLSAIFKRPINTVKLALEVFVNFGMIEIIDNVYTISNWEKHQNIDGLQKIKEQNNLRQQKFQDKKKKMLIENNVKNNVSKTLDITLYNALDIDKELDNIINTNNISTPTIPNVKKNYGEFKKVLLTDEEYKKIKDLNYISFIEKLDLYKESTGKKYKSDYATILNWSKKEQPQKANFVKTKKVESVPDWYDDYEKQLKEVDVNKVLSQEEIQRILNT